MAGEIKNQNRLLSIVNKLSVTLLQSDAAAFEGTLLSFMERLGEIVEVDRVYLWEHHLNNGELCCSQMYGWSDDTGLRQGKTVVREALYRDMPRWEEMFRQGDCLNGLARDLPARECTLLSQQGIRSILMVPLFLGGRFRGGFGFDDCRKERRFSKNEETVLRVASELIAGDILNRQMEKRIAHLEHEADKIFYDSLTGLYNRRFFDNAIQRIHHALSRAKGLLSLMMVDIDYFKRFNDTYGHLQGDTCLRRIADALRASASRAADVVARYGGEEFVIILPNTPEAGAHIVAYRILENIHKLNIPHRNSDIADHVTVSIGGVTYNAEHGRDTDFYLRHADDMLYASKRNGRNRYTSIRM